MTALRGIPERVLAADLTEGTVTLTVPEALYPIDALYAASFAFIDEYWVFVEVPEAGKYAVVLARKDGESAEKDLEVMAGRFANELLSAAFREKLTEQNKATLEVVTFQAMNGAAGPPSLDELDDFDFSEDPFEDPLGIAESWEEKYGKKGADKGAEKGSQAESQAEPQEETPEETT
ncbi:MAG: hypothetical protein JRH11_08920 [Deltaproteobacteria bacterium]|nr:hypothetical protein [Deltaproteobacteria bacterium]